MLVKEVTDNVYLSWSFITYLSQRLLKKKRIIISGTCKSITDEIKVCSQSVHLHVDDIGNVIAGYQN